MKARSAWRTSWISGSCLWVACVSFIFARFGNEIDAVNARIRTFLVSGKSDIRTFSPDGIPYSHFNRPARTVISPFYVVHYGLIYSSLFQQHFQGRPGWDNDLSIGVWDVQPDHIAPGSFKNCADWVVENVGILNGQSHLIYDFDWPYANYPNGLLTAPWWSGLTDAYAIILMLRAYDVYGELKYLDTATRLYHSVTMPLAQGGSRTDFDGVPWIEEYIDPSVEPKTMSRVLNGMIYATYAIEAFERYSSTPQSERWSERFLRSIIARINRYDNGGWSYYDAAGTGANIKYHRIHVALLSNLSGRFNVQSLDELRTSWAKTSRWAGFYWVRSGGVSVAKMQFAITYGLILLCPGIALVVRHVGKRRSGRRIDVSG